MDHPSYGDVLRRPNDQAGRDDIHATEDWTPVALPGQPDKWRHWTDGQQVDLDHP